MKPLEPKHRPWACRKSIEVLIGKFAEIHEVDPQRPIGQGEDLLLIDAIYCSMEINAQPVQINIDTCAKCNVIILDIL